MAHRRRKIHGFQGTDGQYIAYVENLIAGSTCSPPSTTLSSATSSINALPSLRDVAEEGPRHGSTASDRLEIIQYKPNESITEKRQVKAQRWMQAMDRLFLRIHPTSLLERRTELGLSSEAGIMKALDFLIYGKSLTNAFVAPHHPANSVSQLLADFDNTTSTLEEERDFARQICAFRRFLTVSICCVALHNGTALDTVNQILRRQVSDSSEKNLARLRKAAVWVNQVMAELVKDNFAHLAYEVFVLWGGSFRQYCDFSDAGPNGLSYFISNIPKLEPQCEVQAVLPFWVPFIIKVLVGDLYSLSSICHALKYGEDPRVCSYRRHLEYYRTRKIPPPQVALQGVQSNRKRTCQSPATESKSTRLRLDDMIEEHNNVGAEEGQASLHGHDTMRCLLDAAEHIAGVDEPLSWLANPTGENQTYSLAMASNIACSQQLVKNPIVRRLPECSSAWEPMLQSPPAIHEWTVDGSAWEHIFPSTEDGFMTEG